MLPVEWTCYIYAGATYFDQGANLGDQSYKRYTYRAGVDVRLTNDIKLSATVAGNEGKSDQIYTKGACFKTVRDEWK